MNKIKNVYGMVFEQGIHIFAKQNKTIKTPTLSCKAQQKKKN